MMKKYFLSPFLVFLFINTPMNALALSPTQRIKEQYTAALAQEEQKIKNELCDLLKITLQEFEHKKNLYRRDYYEKNSIDIYYELQANNKPFSRKLASIIHHVLEKLDPQKELSVVNINECRMTTGARTIFISEDYIEKYCANDLETIATLIHEIMHIHHEDTFQEYVLLILKSTRPYVDEDAWHTAMHKLSIFCEKRADIQTCLLDIQYAQAGAQRFRKLIHSNIGSGDTHPLHAVRAEYMQKIADELYSAHTAEANDIQISC